MSHDVLADPDFYSFLEAVDLELAEEARGRGCPVCGGKLHSARYLRRPRGGPIRRAVRHSFCCAADGCRRRQTPPSVLFLGRRIHLGAVVVLASALRNGLKPRRVEKLREVLGVSERTLVRWRRWWLRDFSQSPFWRSLRRQLPPGIDRLRLPASLFGVLEGDGSQRLRKLLRLLSPVSSSQGLLAVAG